MGKDAILLTALVVVGLGVSNTATAQPAPLYGSDSLFDVTSDIISACGLGASFSYQGGGSGKGGKAMGAGDASAVPPIPAHSQQIAPQSRFLSATECSAIAPNQGSGLVIGLDDVVIAADTTGTANTCNTLRYSRSPALAGYVFTDWRDVLRVIYTGQTTKVSLDPCAPTNPAVVPAAPGPILGRCDSAIRAALVANWSEMFEESSCTNGNCAGGLRHAFRRDDVSGTTDVFLALLGLPAVNSRTFCNGFANEDLDPLRRPCDAQEQVCSNIPYANRNSDPEGGKPPADFPPKPAPCGNGVLDAGEQCDDGNTSRYDGCYNCAREAVGPIAANTPGDLGLVLTVTMPTDTTKQYPPLCPSPIGGAFAWVSMPSPGGLEYQRCPDGNPRTFTWCRWPIIPTGLNAGKICLARIGNRPGGRVFVNMDARAYNLIPREPLALLRPMLLPNSPFLQEPRWGGGGWYRLHQTAPMPNGTGTCTQTTATRQIGCLVNADPCSIGYAGRESLAWSGSSTALKALMLRSPINDGTVVAPTAANTILLLDPAGGATCGNGPGDNFGYRYPLANKLWINASVGLANVTSPESQLLQCASDRSNGITDGALVAHGMIALPSAPYPTRVCP